YGFPIDLTKEIVAERGMTVDEEEFRRLMLEQRERARAARKNAGADAWEGETDLLENVPATDFLGYTQFETESRVLAIVKDGERVESATAGDEIVLVLDRTAFYGESGGQVGDTGSIESADAILAVTNTTKNHAKNYLHHASVTAGQITVGETVKAAVDSARRLSIMRNHTAAHLLQASLRRVLGDHVEQAGQLVNEQHVRFDFTHFSALTKEELARVEAMVNKVILSALPVECREMPIEEAKKLGAMALFGEKYGSVVRVVSVGDFSKEFCGGTHIDNTAKLGLFKIVFESSVAAGVRRIEGVTGAGVLALLNRTLEEIGETAAALRLNGTAELPQKAAQLTAELKEKDRTVETLNARLAAMQIGGLFAGAKEVGGVKLITGIFEGTEPAALRAMCDKVRDHAPNMVAVLAGVTNGRANIAACVAKDALKMGVNAGQIVRRVAQLAGGNGGGRPDSAMAGAKDLTKLEPALAEAEKIVANMIK
ncbi:MAG: alanine--tRNA ligase, partial [Clostridiales bacterium]|nr:alanine--tRNA ligase [Clostridiales bacterium]